MSRNTDIARQVASQYLQKVSARPIPIDERAFDLSFGGMVDDLRTALRKHARGGSDESLGKHNKLATDVMTLRRPDGKKVTFRWLIRSRPRGASDIVLGGGFGRIGGKPGIVIDINGKPPAALIESMLDRGEPTWRELRTVVLHEVTHAIDPAIDGTGGGGSEVPDSKAIDLEAYFNQPQEIRAFMRQISEEALGYAERLSRSYQGNKLFRTALSFSPSWKQIKPHLTDRNRQRLLKGIHTAFRDEGLL